MESFYYKKQIPDLKPNIEIKTNTNKKQHEIPSIPWHIHQWRSIKNLFKCLPDDSKFRLSQNNSNEILSARTSRQESQNQLSDTIKIDDNLNEIKCSEYVEPASYKGNTLEIIPEITKHIKNSYYQKVCAYIIVYKPELPGKIQLAYRSFLNTKNTKKPGYAGLVHMVYTAKDGTRYDYYHLPESQGRIWGRQGTKRVNQEISGTYKTLSFEDYLFVTLRLKKKTRDESSVIAQRDRFEALKDLRSFCIPLQVSDSMLVSRNAGTDLLTLTFKDKFVTIKQFEKACRDMAVLHDRDFAHRDIKSENFSVKYGGDIVIIDLDSMLLTHDNRDRKRKLGTRFFMTENLYKAKAEGDLAGIKRGDNYAFLLSMFETTHPKTTEILGRVCSQLQGVLNRGKSPDEGLFFYMNQQDQTIAHAWLTRVIKPEHIEEIKKFLANPDMILTRPLSEMINWDAKL